MVSLTLLLVLAGEAVWASEESVLGLGDFLILPGNLGGEVPTSRASGGICACPERECFFPSVFEDESVTIGYPLKAIHPARLPRRRLGAGEPVAPCGP